MTRAQRLTPNNAAEQAAGSSLGWGRVVVSWLIAAALLYWAFHGVSWQELLAACAKLDAIEIVLLLAFNLLALPLFGLRWWLICNADLPHEAEPSVQLRVGLLDVTLYRWAAFGLSYLTPGPLVGGEPLQVILLERRHGMKRAQAIASVVLDRTLELTVSFGALLAGGIFLLMRVGQGAVGQGTAEQGMVTGVEPSFELLPSLLALTLLVALPFVYFTLLARGHSPMATLAAWISRDGDRSGAMVAAIGESESLVAQWLRHQRFLLVAALLVSLLGFLAVLIEFFLVVRFLELPANFDQTLLAFVAARLAQLALLPGALGALEASQLLSWRLAGLLDALGLAVSLVVRARDLLFAVTGLLIGLALLRRSSDSVAR